MSAPSGSKRPYTRAATAAAAASSTAAGAVADAALPRRTHPRHFHAGAHPRAGDEEEATDGQPSSSPAAGAAAVPTRPVLQSVFAFCDLRTLRRVLSTCRGWHAAVLTMKSIAHRMDGYLPSGRALTSLLVSPLRYHVSHIGNEWWQLHLSEDKLEELARQMPQLRTLCTRVNRATPSLVPLRFPAQLRELRVELHMQGDAGMFARFMTAVSTLAQLEMLEVSTHAANVTAEVSFASLALLPNLRSLRLCHRYGEQLTLADAHIQQLRALRRLRFIGPFGVENLIRLAALPHQLEWQEVDFEGSTPSQQVLAALVTLPITRVDFTNGSQSVDFLLQLPHLTDLQLGGFCDEEPLDVSRVQTVLMGCTNLTSLALHESADYQTQYISTALLLEVLARMPHLRSLQLIRARTPLPSLSFLSAGSLWQSLTALHLSEFASPLPTRHLRHVLPLRSLTALTIDESVLRPRVGRLHVDLLRQALPALTTVDVAMRKEDDFWRDD